jgi:dihydroorotate dehydrogenase
METFISAPFGNYIKPKKCIPVTGTWTLQPRGNRALSVLKTLRYNRQLGGWTNKLSLSNPGIAVGSVKTQDHEVLSIAQVDEGDFAMLNYKIWSSQNLEINLSCPNISQVGIWTDVKIFLKSGRDWCIAKVSPLITLEDIEYLIDDIGFTQIHFSNTLSISAGGLSGPELRPYTLELIKLTRKHFGDKVTIIAGGGIQHIGHVTEYMNAGANHISLGSVCFNPIKLWKLLRALR